MCLWRYQKVEFGTLPTWSLKLTAIEKPPGESENRSNTKPKGEEFHERNGQQRVRGTIGMCPQKWAT